ncbi:hypothetical protein MTBUT4_150018 [Magnetospirillum sp. UT-4]|nr:hypothetical protein MTBUT4_150018 [Magnetospirillum sp. UT-4]
MCPLAHCLTPNQFLLFYTDLENACQALVGIGISKRVQIIWVPTMQEASQLGERATLKWIAVTVLPDGRMDRKNAAVYLGIAPQTLANLAARGRGPDFVRVGGRVFYYLSALDAFIHGERSQ